MQKLISELSRLYLQPGTLPAEVLEQQLLGHPTVPVSLVTDDGMTRAVVIAFHKMPDGEEAQHWSLLCEVANALQAELGLPAPAVSISGSDGYKLWLSLATPAPTALVKQFLVLLRNTYFPNMPLSADDDIAVVKLPPCLHPRTGKWAAFIHPGLGASFADESGLEMAPPSAGQAALLEGLQSIKQAQFLHAIDVLKQSHGMVPMVGEPVSASASAIPGLLLKDATLEDIVRYLHSKNIEPTFRHLIQGPRS
jgi:hypothetical protein